MTHPLASSATRSSDQPSPTPPAPTVRQRLQRLWSFSSDARGALLTTLLAAAAAFSAVAFMAAIKMLFKHTIGHAAQFDPLRFAALSFASITVSSLIVGWLLARYCRAAAGSGVPQVKLAFDKDIGAIPWRAVWVKFIAGIVSVGGGASLGREGPSVFVGAGVASCLARALGVPRRRRRAASIVGAAAGLAAAFNTPLAAVAFAMEEVIRDFGSRLLGRVILAAIVGALLTHALLGAQPAFELPNVDEPRIPLYALVAAVAVLSSLTAALFQKLTLVTRAAARRMTRVPAWLHPCLGGWIVWGLGVAVFAATGRTGVFGLGYDDLAQALSHGIAGRVALALVVGKLLATIAAYGFGGCGGIFAPTLFFGGMIGYAVAGLAHPHITLAPSDRVLLASVGMCACFGATVRAPWTGLLIVFEMTHRFAVIPALLLGTLVSQAVIRLFGRLNFYDAILVQDGHAIHEADRPRTLADWRNQAVSALATPNPVTLPDLAPDTLADALDRYPYARFPVRLPNGRLGIVTRADIQAARSLQTAPRTHEALTIPPDRPVKQAMDLLVQSETGMILVLDPDRADPPHGLLTLHDLLRIQSSAED